MKKLQNYGSLHGNNSYFYRLIAKQILYGHNFYTLNGTGKSIKEMADEIGILSSAQPQKFPEGVEIIIKAKIEESAFYMKIEF